jgi:hypothetical protein
MGVVAVIRHEEEGRITNPVIINKVNAIKNDRDLLVVIPRIQ